jgi:hypothetical protein
MLHPLFCLSIVDALLATLHEYLWLTARDGTRGAGIVNFL